MHAKWEFDIINKNKELSEGKLEMKAMDKNGFKGGVVRWRLAQSVARMKDKADIDSRVYMLTVNMKKCAVPSVLIENCHQA